MKKFSKVFKLVGLLLVMGLLFAALPTGQAQAATTITVCASGCDYTTIQTAINVATIGDTVNVLGGTYAEQVVVSGKTNLTIQGVGDATLIEPAYVVNTAAILIRNSDGLTIQNLKIHTAGEEQQGIWVKGALYDNDLSVTGLTIQNTTIVADGGIGGAAASGIIADASTDAAHSGWLITGNRITASACAIVLQDVTNSTISNNTLTATLGTNTLWTSERFNLTGLVFSDNIVSGSGGSQVTVITDYNQLGSNVAAEVPAVETTITGVTFHGNTFSNWGSRAIRVGDANGTTPGTVTVITIEYNTFQMTTDTAVIGGTDAPSATGTGNIFNVISPAKIQTAIDAAFPGDTVNVAAGTYNEGQILIDKSLTLQGAGYLTTIIDGGGTVTGGLVKITASGTVSLAGFTIQNTNNSDDLGHGVYVDDEGVNVNISDNAIKNVGPEGINVNTASSVQIERNIISSLYSSTEVIPNGIQIGFPDGVGITGTIANNEISGCSWTGYDAATDDYESNTTSAGILIIDTAAALEISDNVIHNNDVGIDIEAGSSTNIVNNDIHDNAYGVVTYNANPSINFNRIVNNSTSGVYRTSFGDSSGVLDATNNWWGCNAGPNTAMCDTTTGTGTITSDPWLILQTLANPTTVDPNGTATITANLRTNSALTDTSAAGFLVNGVPVSFTTTGGVVVPTSGTTLNGQSTTTFTATATALRGTYEVCSIVDNQTICATMTVDNWAPLAVDDAYVTAYYTTLSIIAPGVLANDTDPDSDAKTATLVTNVSHGTLSLLGDGSFTYTPAPGFSGTDTFVYRLVTYPSPVLTAEWTDEALVTITVTPAPYIYYFPLIVK